MTQANVMTGVYQKLLTDNGAGGVAALTGGRIYHLQGPQGAAWPLVLLALVEDQPRCTLAGRYLQAVVQTQVYGAQEAGAAAALAVSDRLYALLHGKSVSISGYSAGQAWCLDRGQAQCEQEAIRIISRWRIWATAS